MARIAVAAASPLYTAQSLLRRANAVADQASIDTGFAPPELNS